MGTVIVTGTPSSGAPGAHALADAYLPRFTGAFTMEATTTPAIPGGSIVNLKAQFIRSSDGFECFHTGEAITSGTSGGIDPWTVGVPGGAWLATDWDTIRWSITSSISLPVQPFSLKIIGSFLPTHCEYGTRLKPTVQNAEVITEGVIAELAIRFPELLPYAGVLGVLVGLTWVPGNVCSGDPPAVPTFTDDDFVFGTSIPMPGTLGKLYQLYQATAWFIACECTPAPGGSPPPTIMPDPVFPAAPPAAYLPPDPITCDDGDLCSVLNSVVGQLRALQRAVTLTRADVQLIQRQGVPFGYVVGTGHSALIGQGQFDVSAIIGLAVEFTSLPGVFPPIGGDPLTYHQIGKVSIGTADGWERSWMPTHSPYLIFPIAGAITRVGYTFPAGIVATIRELVREP